MDQQMLLNNNITQPGNITPKEMVKLLKVIYKSTRDSVFYNFT